MMPQLAPNTPHRYHTHPFDLDANSHCYLSSTDVTTQLQWQRHSDPQGDPWFAIVIDPLRSLAKSVPEMMCFRVHDPTYSPPLNMVIRHFVVSWYREVDPGTHPLNCPLAACHSTHSNALEHHHMTT